MAQFSEPTRAARDLQATGATPRENRIIENHLNAVQSAYGGVARACEIVDELRARLLGISEPMAPQTNQKEAPQLVRAELPELGAALERMQAMTSNLLGKLVDLQGI